MTSSDIDAAVRPTEKQEEVLRRIVRSASEQFQPSYAEMAEEFGVKNRVAIHARVVGLEKKGLLRRPRVGAARALSVTNLGYQVLAALDDERRTA